MTLLSPCRLVIGLEEIRQKKFVWVVHFLVERYRLRPRFTVYTMLSTSRYSPAPAPSRFISFAKPRQTNGIYHGYIRENRATVVAAAQGNPEASTSSSPGPGAKGGADLRVRRPCPLQRIACMRGVHLGSNTTPPPSIVSPVGPEPDPEGPGRPEQQ